MNSYFNCWPVIIYSVLSLLSIVSSFFLNDDQLQKRGIRSKGMYIVLNVIFTLIGYAILHLLCKHGYYKTAWVVLFLPTILSVFSFMLIVIGLKSGKLKVEDLSKK